MGRSKSGGRPCSLTTTITAHKCHKHQPGAIGSSSKGTARIPLFKKMHNMKTKKIIRSKNHHSQGTHTQTSPVAGKADMQPSLIKKYFQKEQNLWGALKRVPGYGIQCAQLKSPMKYTAGIFCHNLVRDTETGPIYFAFFQPIIYPGKKRIFFEVQYITPDRMLHCDIVVFRTEAEPKQSDAINIMEGILLTLAACESPISLTKKWNAAYMFRDYFDLLRLAVYTRKTSEQTTIINNLYNRNL